jgi:hypothetical protein
MMKKFNSLNEFFEAQPADMLQQIMLVRELLFEVESNLQESLKWNAPNYSYLNEDRITFNLMNKQGILKVIIHMGAKKKEDTSAKPVLDGASDLVTWNSNIRGTISFADYDEIQAKSERFKQVIAEWIRL